jgi:hypothetical protein
MSAIPQEYIKKFTKDNYYALHKEERLFRHTELLLPIIFTRFFLQTK